MRQSQIPWTFVLLKIKKTIEQLANMSTKNDLMQLSDQFMNFELSICYQKRLIHKWCHGKKNRDRFVRFYTKRSQFPFVMEWKLIFWMSIKKTSTESKNIKLFCWLVFFVQHNSLLSNQLHFEYIYIYIHIAVKWFLNLPKTTT